MITGNKGEWSEIYAFFKILSDGKITLGNDALKKMEEILYPIIKVIRLEAGKYFEYSLNDKLVIISSEGEKISEVPVHEFKNKASELLELIKENKSRTFSSPDVEDFMNTIKCMTLKAKSTSKSDIKIVIHDSKTNQQPLLGFSIKSQLGNPSTLLNASKSTNFIYQINNIDIPTSEINSINAISSTSKIKDRIQKVVRKGGVFSFVRIENQIFQNNCILIDSAMPDILASFLYYFFSSKHTSLVDLLTIISNENPQKFNNSEGHLFYEYKIKKLLTDIALGMTPTNVWNGQYDATGGYLIIKEDGEIICYHIYNKNEFENYLLSNTKLETPSSSRHGFGDIYEDNGNLYFKLNLQIRFMK